MLQGNPDTQNDFDVMNSPQRERIFNYASLAMPSTSSAFSNILQLSHFDRLINFLTTYSRTYSMISRVLVPKITSITVTHS